MATGPWWVLVPKSRWGLGAKTQEAPQHLGILKGMIYTEIQVCTYYEKIKVSTRTPEDLLFAVQNFGAPKREFAPGPRNTIGGLLTCLNEN